MDAEYVRRNFNYDETTGLFTWAVNNAHKRKPGNSVGSLDSSGYIRIKLKNVYYAAHRLAWLHHYGAYPLQVIDHINGVRSDNRIANLRDVSQKENLRNANKETFGKGKRGPIYPAEEYCKCFVCGVIHKKSRNTYLKGIRMGYRPTCSSVCRSILCALGKQIQRS